jgi:hypothetical protein
MHTKMMSIGKRIPLAVSIAFQAFSVKVLSIGQQAGLSVNATQPLSRMDLSEAPAVIRQFPAAFEHFNEVHPPATENAIF